MKFEHFPEEYEKVFNSPKKLKRFKTDMITSATGESLDEYIIRFRTFMREKQMIEYQHMVKMYWLINNMRYNGKKRVPTKSNGFYMDGAYDVFMRNLVGYDPKYLKAHERTMISSYFPDLYPNLESDDPFKNEQKYPFEYLPLEAMVFVCKMEERWDLLNEGERRRMSLTTFYDYVINYICSYNEKYGYTYDLVRHDQAPRYIRVIKKKK